MIMKMRSSAEKSAGFLVLQSGVMVATQLLLDYDKNTVTKEVKVVLASLVESIEDFLSKDGPDESLPHVKQSIGYAVDHLFRGQLTEKDTNEAFTKFSKHLSSTLVDLCDDVLEDVYVLYMESALETFLQVKKDKGYSRWLSFESDVFEESDHVKIFIDGWKTPLVDFEEESEAVAEIVCKLVGGSPVFTITYGDNADKGDTMVKKAIEEGIEEIQGKMVKKSLKEHDDDDSLMLYAYYKCDQWESLDSMRLQGIFTHDKLIDNIMEDVEKGDVEVDDRDREDVEEMDNRTLNSLLEYGFVEELELNERQ